MEPRVPHPLFDLLMEHYDLTSDRALAMKLGTYAPDISRIRNRKRAMGAELILRIHELTDMPVKRIKELLE